MEWLENLERKRLFLWAGFLLLLQVAELSPILPGMRVFILLYIALFPVILVLNLAQIYLAFRIWRWSRVFALLLVVSPLSMALWWPILSVNYRF